MENIQTDAPGDKGYKPTWVGNQGKITLGMNMHSLIVEPRFDAGKVLDRSVSKFAWERLTRGVFGPDGASLGHEVIKGVLLGLLATGPLVLAALFLRRQGHAVFAYGFCVLGAIVFLALLILAIGVGAGTYSEEVFLLAGAGFSGLVGFTVGSVLTARRKLSDSGAPEVTSEAKGPLA